MKKRGIVITFVIVVLIILIVSAIVVIHFIDKNESEDNTIIDVHDENFREKISCIKNIISEEQNLDEEIAIISISDGNSQAIVKFWAGDSKEQALESVSNNIEEYIIENEYNVEYVEVEFMKTIRTISLTKLNYLIQQSDDNFSYGIIFGDDILVTREEIFANGIINYDYSAIDISILNEYLEKQGRQTIDEIPDSLTIFTTEGYFCDNENNVYEIDDTYGVRSFDEVDEETIEFILENATEYLENMIDEDGKFVYGYNIVEDRELTSYNILRHARKYMEFNC